MDMWKGSTPTLAFKFPFKTNTINALTFKCKQGDTVKISKSLSDFSTSGEDILYILLTQSDTLALASEEYVTIQFKVQFTNNHVVPSSKMILPVQDVIDTVAMVGTATAELPSMSLNVPFPQVDGGFSVVMGMAVSSGSVTSVAWADITGKPETFPPSSHTHTKSQITDFPNIPSKTSDLTNDSGFITGVSWGDVSNKPETFTPSSHTHNKSEITDFPTLAAVATSGNYGDLSNKPSIPTKTTDLTNDSGFITNAVNDLTNYYLKTGTYSKEEVNALISAVKQFAYEVVSALPTASESTMNKIYLIPSSSSAVSNVKDEYITIDGGASVSPRYAWEQIGSTSIDLSAYRTASAQDVIDATLQPKNDNSLNTTSKNVVGAINEVANKVLPSATEDGTALVYYDDAWNITKGFGYYYIDEETIFSDTINASDFISAGSYYTHVYNNLMPIENGKTYSVTFNGVEYECSAFPIPEQINNSVCIGNFSIVRQGAENTGEPFFIGAISLDYPTTITTTSVAINFEPQNAVIFSVAGDVELASKFDADLLPLPTKTSDLTNDSGFLTSHQSLSAYRTASAQDLIDAEKASASVVSSHTSNSDIHVTANQKSAWSGKQDAISDLSSIRSGASAGATAVQPSAISDMATKTWVGGQGYLRSHQDISGKENISNKVTSMTAQSTDTQYPSAKAVYDEISQLNEDLDDKIEYPGHPSDNKFYAMKNDEWTEFSGGGAGIDDTTTALDKTWSSSKVNAEFGSLRSKITIRCVNENSQQVSGNSVLVKSVNGNYAILNTTYSGSNIELYIPKETKISITLGYISGYATPLKSTFVVGNDETKTFVYKDDIVYGFHINASESNPSDAVTYLEGATGATPAHMDFINNEFDYGAWENAFFMPRPCMLKSDGTVDYYLDPDDYTKKVDGVTPSDVANTGYDGNAMMEWGNGSKIWYKVIPDEGSSFSGSVYISNAQVDSEYKSWSFIDSHNNAIDHFYTPIYNGSLVGDKLRSLSAQTCINSKTANNEVSYALANNTTSSVEWYTEVFSDVQLINFLLVLMGKSLNTQDVFGYGHYTGGSSASNLLTTGTMNTKGMFWGSNQTGVGVKVFGMENWWGNQWRRYAGHMNVSNKNKYKMTYGTADGSSANSYNFDGTGYLSDSTTISGTSGGYITQEKFIPGIGIIPTAVIGTSDTYYSDGCYFSNGTMYALRGGACNHEFLVGTFASRLSHTASISNWNNGSAPSCKPLAR